MTTLPIKSSELISCNKNIGPLATNIHYSINTFQKLHSKKKKQDTKYYILYDLIYMTFYKTEL